MALSARKPSWPGGRSSNIKAGYTTAIVPIAGSVKVASANAGGVHIQLFWGEDVTEWKGSRVGLKNGGERIVVHRPHTGSVTGRATVRDIAAFLDAAGVVAPREQDDE